MKNELGGFILILSVIVSLNAFAEPLPADLQIIPSDSLPANATWFSLQHWGTYPPSPINWCADLPNIFYYRSLSFGTNKIVIDDSAVDYNQPVQSSSLVAMDTSSGPPMPPGGGSGGGGGGTNGPSTYLPHYTYGQFYLDIQRDTNTSNQADIIAHGVTNALWNNFSHITAGFCQLLFKTNIIDPTAWKLSAVKTADGTTNDLWFTVADSEPQAEFFRAVVATNVASISVYQDHAIEPDNAGNGAQTGLLLVSLQNPNYSDVTIFYGATGSATVGVDYTNFPGSISSGIGSVVIPAMQQSVFVTLYPLHDPKIDFDEIATFALILTNGYAVNPSFQSGSIRISDNFGTSNLFEVVATNAPGPIDIDYYPPTQSLLLSANFGVDGATNFVLLTTSNTFHYWSPTRGIGQGAIKEIKIATVKGTLNGFTNGDLFYDNGLAGGIGWVSSNGASISTNWAANSQLAANEPDVLGGDLYADRTGVWGNDLLAVTGDEGQLTGTRGIWRIHSATNATLVVRIPSPHLEGLLTVSNDVTKYGPWAGKLLTGDDYLGIIYAVDTNGNYLAYDLKISPDTIRLIETNQDLYCVDFNQYDQNQSLILKVSRKWLTTFVGDILMVQAGENAGQSPTLFIVHWNGIGFEVHSLALHDYRSGIGDFFEKATFAPITLPTIAP